MNISAALNLISLEQSVASRPVIPAHEIDRLLQAQNIIEVARQRAAEYLQSARQQRGEARARFQRRMAQQRRGWRRHYRKIFAQAKMDGTEAALNWLVDQQRWEHLVYQRLTKQIAGLLSERLQVISRDLPWEGLLFEQLGPLCNELQNAHPLTLKISPALSRCLSQDVLALPLTVEQDESLAFGDALLETQLVRVELKLPGQINLLCEALEKLSWEALREPN